MAMRRDDVKERRYKLAIKKVFDLDGARVTVTIALDPELPFDAIKDFDVVEEALEGMLACVRSRAFDGRPMVRDHWLKDPYIPGDRDPAPGEESRVQ